MARFFHDGPLALGSSVRLSDEEAHHLGRVLRMEAGETIELVDGRGGVARATLEEVASKRASAKIDELRPVPARSRLRLCFGIPKGAALEFLVRRATELGVGALQPLETQHSLHVKEWNEGRWKKNIVEVGKQCEEAWFPELLAPRKFSEWLKSRDTSAALIFCDEAKREATLSLAGSPACDLLVGAEGGWSAEERSLLLSAGAFSLGLGRNRLRAETAALVASVLVKERLGEL